MSIYVISNDLNIKNNLFKVGRTKDTNTDIVAKYQRYLSGARLLLWYPSTIIKYVEDEREILRIFDSNRNRTPNGFKNEWLSIPFEQLKTKMDEYFGHDGEIFEEEQKRERENRQKEKEERKIEKEMIQFTCEFCSKIFSFRKSLKRHYPVCREKLIHEIEQIKVENTQLQVEKNQLVQQLEQLEQKCQSKKKQLDQQRKEYEQQLDQLHKEHEQQLHIKEHEIQSLKEQLSEFKNQLFEIVKQPKQQ